MKEDKEGMVKEKGAVTSHLEVNMRPKRKMKMWVLVKTRGMRISTALVIETLEIREEEVEDMTRFKKRRLPWYLFPLQ